MNHLTFDKATKSDLPTIIQMYADDILGSQREQFERPLPSFYTDAFEKINADSNQELIIVKNKNNESVGTLQLTFIPYLVRKGTTRALIEAVRVHSNHRGLGIGEAIFRWAIERSREKGATLVQLTTDKKRPDAKRFYEKLGFEASHEGMKLQL